MPYTLLLADDSATIQRVIELTFADEDVTVVAVSDGDQAIARLQVSPPDIVLADIGMPGRNGYDVADYIRQSPKLSHIPVVLLTGAFEPVDEVRANEAGCEGVLAKPFEPQQVIARVKELLARPARALDDAAPALDLAAVDEGEFSPASPEAGPMPATPPAESIWRWPISDDEDAASLVDPVAVEEATESLPRTAPDDYFDRLDAAFSMLSSNPAQQAVPPVTANPDPTPPAAEFDWFGSKPAVDAGVAEPWDERPAPSGESHPAEDVPPSHVSPPTEPSVAAPEPVAPVVPSAIEDVADAVSIAAPDERLAPIEESLPIEPEDAPVAAGDVSPPAVEPPGPTRAPLPALADAFAALLAAEQGEPLPMRSGLWPSTMAPSADVREELVEEVVRRVLDRLSDAVVRDAVVDVVSTVAERLIREEIERIKASIK